MPSKSLRRKLIVESLTSDEHIDSDKMAMVTAGDVADQDG